MKKPKFQILPFLLLLLLIGKFRPSLSSNEYQFDERDDLQERLFQLSMDSSVPPCENFYQYACGNWESESERDYQETLTKLDFEIKQEMVKVLQTLNRSSVGKRKFAREVYNYYKSCISQDVPETVEYIKWLETHERSIQWPISEQSNRPNQRQSYDWVAMLGTLRKYGMNDVILHESVSPMELTPNMLTIELGRPQTDNRQMNNLRYDVVTGTLRFFMQQREYNTLWSGIQDLENKLVELKAKYEQEEEVLFTTVSGLSDVPWLQQYLSILLDDRRLDPNMDLVITNIAYLKAVMDFLQRYDQKFVCVYLQVKFLSYLNYKQFKPEYRDCVTTTRLLLPLPSQWLYEQQHPELEHEITNISLLFSSLKQSFLRILNRNVYNLDQSTMNFFKAKLRTLQLRIRFLTAHSLDELYANLTLSPTDYYGNRLKIYYYHFKAAHRHLNIRLKRNALEFLPLEEYDTAKSLLPYLLSRQRALMVPLSILQHPVYRPELPPAYIYSSIGFLLARQLMWEFTIADIDVSAYGQVYSYILEMLLEKPQFKMDYDHIETYHRGESEVVDSAITGLKLAYQAFKDDEHDVRMTRSFFLNFAQMYCGTRDAGTGSYRPTSMAKNQKIVNLAVNHIEDFASTFGCRRERQHGVLYWGTNYYD